ncbi:MAG: glycosyltransferase [Candidatus Eisenbacteria bacterium]|nr:glycosyltransferase [Candidatus Latescibacterota bacterium]MBD3303191.1 glycosyltransferase [Candidatus Eisenbacteria bacterium]
MESPNPRGVSVVIPAYNEQEGIEEVVRQIGALPGGIESGEIELIVVDDGSTDATAARAERAGARVIRHGWNRGYGAALKTGILAARGWAVVITDADGTYPNERIPELVALLEEHEMVVGARTGAKVAIPWIRRPAKWFLNKLANYLSEARIPDLNSGLRAFRRETLLGYFGMLPSGFSFTTTITLAMHVNDLRIAYLPIDYHARQGKSKIRPIQDTLNFLALIVRTILYFRPLKIFLPIAGVLFLASVGIFVYSALYTEKIMDASVTITLMTSFQMAAIGLLADLIDKRSQR